MLISNKQRAEHDYTDGALQKTSDLLTQNPEYYSIWNYRRLILKHQISNITGQEGAASDAPEPGEPIKRLLQSDIEFLFPLLKSYPKCYWIWNYRLWLLEQATQLLSPDVARSFWQQELALVGKMLSLDSRNFHGWGYRRTVVDSLEVLGTEVAADKVRTTTQTELDYTTKMIGTNLSNFSAWHSRSKLIMKALDERSAGSEERKKTLDAGKSLRLYLFSLSAEIDNSEMRIFLTIFCSQNSS